MCRKEGVKGMTLENGKDRAVASGEKRNWESVDIRGARPADIPFFITIAPI
jgi:hypothetical protein